MCSLKFEEEILDVLISVTACLEFRVLAPFCLRAIFGSLGSCHVGISSNLTSWRSLKAKINPLAANPRVELPNRVSHKVDSVKK